MDAATGQITGRLEHPGTHDLVFEVSNARGTASRPFRIVCGETLALTPHMGWNSWYVWENHVTDKIIRDAADAMVRSGMIDHGYTYVNIDDCWAVKPGAPESELGGAPRDAAGKVNPNSRFPDMKALADYIHARGLKAGIYTSPGPLTCGGHVGTYQHEEQDVQRFVEWGYDFLKYDWCSYGTVVKHPDRAALQKPYKLIGDILKRQPRDIVLNLCQYGMGDVWEWGKSVGGQSWRTAGDFGGTFEDIPAALFRDGFDLYADRELHRYRRAGRLERPRLPAAGLPEQLEGQDRPHAALARRAVHPRLALVPAGRALDLQRRHHAAGRFHSGPALQRRGDRGRSGPAGPPGPRGWPRTRSLRSGPRTWRTAHAPWASSTAANLPRPSPQSGRTWGFPGPASFATSGDSRTSASSTAGSGRLSPVTAWCWCGSVGCPEPCPAWDKIPILS